MTETPKGRVLVVTSSFPRWEGDSATPFVLHLAQDLQEIGWHVHVLAPHGAGASRSGRIDGVSVERFRYWWPESGQTVCYGGGALINLRNNRVNLLKVPLLVAAEMRKVAQRLGTGRFDIVHSHWILPQGFAAGVITRMLSVPHVQTVHGGDVFALRGRILASFKRLAMGLADTVTVNSSATHQAVELIGHGTVPVVRIPMGVDPPTLLDPAAIAAIRARYRRGRGPLLIFVGRLIEEKGVADLLAAIALLRDAHPDVTGLIVGDGPDRARFQALAQQLGIGDVVCFAGWVSSREVGTLLGASDMFVGPSKRAPDGWTEAQGLTIVEAMMAGVPVVTTGSGGIVDVVSHRETGMVVAEGEPAAIAAAVHDVYFDDQLRSQLVANARALVERDFTRMASARRFSELFEAVVRRKRKLAA